MEQKRLFSEKQRNAMNKRLYGKRLKINCSICKKEFTAILYRIKNGKAKCCSNRCKGVLLKLIKRKPLSEEAKIKIGLSSRGRKNYYLSKINKTKEHRDLVSRTIKGRVINESERKMRREAALKSGCYPPHYRGKDHYNWKGGLTKFVVKIRKLKIYKEWRKAVFERDNYTCVICGKTKTYLNADHINKFSIILREYNIKTIEDAIKCIFLWDVNNGRTLCLPCHRKTDTWGRKEIK